MKTELITTGNPAVKIDWLGNVKLLNTSYSDGSLVSYTLTEAIELRDFLNQLELGENGLLEACKIVVSGYEGDGMEQMGVRDGVFYRHCKAAINKALGINLNEK